MKVRGGKIPGKVIGQRTEPELLLVEVYHERSDTSRSFLLRFNLKKQSRKPRLGKIQCLLLYFAASACGISSGA